VFFLTGFWHGANYNFIVWGMLHGFFMVIERFFLKKLIEKNAVTRMFGRIYTLVTVYFCWIFFRANSLSEAVKWIKIIFSRISIEDTIYTIEYFVSYKTIFIVVVAILFMGIIQNIFKRLNKMLFDENKIYFLESIVQFVLLFICIVLLVNNTYNPFIYFKF
jgi:alginate O-acetyltransferase complex protein AlgI